MEHFNGILFHKSKPASKQHTNQSEIYMEIWNINNFCINFCMKLAFSQDYFY